MSVLPILRWPDPRLSAPCEVVGEITPVIARLAEDMLETMYAAPGRGLAASQVGVMRRLFVMDATWKEGTPDPMVFVNPVLRAADEATVTRAEACLSIPGISTEITRPARVFVGWIDLDGRRREAWFDGFAAGCVQHEMDHLDGRVTFDRLEPEARAAAIARYEAVA